MKVYTFPQRSDEWYRIRLGKLTGSNAAAILATIKTGEAAARRDYRMRLVCERLTGQAQEDGPTTDAMQRGIDMETHARAAYEAHTGQIVSECGFVSHDNLPAGCSPDGYIGDWQGLVSFKCPKTATHVGYLSENRMPPAYVPQMLAEMWLTGAQWYDFVSFDDRLPERLSLFTVRVKRNDAAIADFEAKARTFLEEVQRDYASLLGFEIVKETAHAI